MAIIYSNHFGFSAHISPRLHTCFSLLDCGKDGGCDQEARAFEGKARRIEEGAETHMPPRRRLYEEVGEGAVPHQAPSRWNSLGGSARLAYVQPSLPKSYEEDP